MLCTVSWLSCGDPGAARLARRRGQHDHGGLCRDGEGRRRRTAARRNLTHYHDPLAFIGEKWCEVWPGVLRSDNASLERAQRRALVALLGRAAPPGVVPKYALLLAVFDQWRLDERRLLARLRYGYSLEAVPSSKNGVNLQRSPNDAANRGTAFKILLPTAAARWQLSAWKTVRFSRRGSRNSRSFRSGGATRRGARTARQHALKAGSRDEKNRVIYGSAPGLL